MNFSISFSQRNEALYEKIILYTFDSYSSVLNFKFPLFENKVSYQKNFIVQLAVHDLLNTFYCTYFARSFQWDLNLLSRVRLLVALSRSSVYAIGYAPGFNLNRTEFMNIYVFRNMSAICEICFQSTVKIFVFKITFWENYYDWEESKYKAGVKVVWKKKSVFLCKCLRTVMYKGYTTVLIYTTVFITVFTYMLIN